MSSEYQQVKVGKLKLKGEKTKKRKSKKRKQEDDCDGSSGSAGLSAEQQDTIAHGGWWKSEAVHEIRGDIAIQLGSTPVYITALDNGCFTIGPPHNEGEGPHPEEILTTIPTGDSRKLAFKSGYGKYVSVDNKGRMVARAEAIGPREMWTPVFQDGQTALLSATDCFVGVDDADDIVATSAKAGTDEMITIRCKCARAKDDGKEVPSEEKGSLKDVELNYVKKFQKFQDKRILMNSEGRFELKDARDKGKLHEALLDRRSKMKADRYCK
uniref:Protein FRG1 homolog n=1 Tax=Hirondellea gigas TaxID=1518452 RepID=A0A2P2I249_9CRUS